MDKTKAKIQELCPDVMELRFGCEVVVTLRSPKNEGQRLSTKITTLMSDGAWMTLNFGEYQESELTILGSPITLATVIRAYHERSDAPDNDVSILGIVSRWRLADDNYDAQNEQTKQYIGTLLGIV